MSSPEAVCQSCGKHYSGWWLAQTETCDCGGKLIIDFPCDYIIGYIKGGRRKKVENTPEREDTNGNSHRLGKTTQNH